MGSHVRLYVNGRGYIAKYKCNPVAVRCHVITTVKPLISHLSRELKCWSLRCSWNIACRRSSKYIFILDLTPDFNGLGKVNCKSRPDTVSLGICAPIIRSLTVRMYTSDLQGNFMLFTILWRIYRSLWTPTSMIVSDQAGNDVFCQRYAGLSRNTYRFMYSLGFYTVAILTFMQAT